MPLFRYQAATSDGRTVRGTLEADTPGLAGERLDASGLIPLDVRPSVSLIDRLRAQRGGSAWDIQEKILFTQKFASLMKAGIPLLTVLEMLARQTAGTTVRESIRQIAAGVANGQTLHDAMATCPRLFDAVYLGAVNAGESTGHLDTVLAQTADYLDREMDTRRRVREAVRYPIMVVIAISIASIVILKFVVPRFLAFYSNFNASLPLPTRMLIAVAGWLEHVWWLFPVLAIVGVFVWRHWTRTEPGRRWRDRMLLRLPIMGSLFLKVAVSRFTRLFGVLHAAGLPATSALDIVAIGAGNQAVGDEVREIRRRLTAGADVGTPPEQALMPELVYEMLGVGFESGDVERMMGEVARHYDQEVDYDVRRLTDRIKPLLLAVLGVGVLILALAVLLPMWNLITLFRQ